MLSSPQPWNIESVVSALRQRERLLEEGEEEISQSKKEKKTKNKKKKKGENKK